MPGTPTLLLRGAIVISVDPDIGTQKNCDILLAQDKILAVGVGLEVGGTQTIDASGWIILPGLVNAHSHTWQTALRGVAANWTLLEYFGWVHRGLATVFEPQDIHIATLMGALGQINAGTTTLVDWCHNNPTPEHTDAAIDALFESNIRAAFFHGSPKPDPQPGKPHFSAIPHPRAEITRLLNSRFSNRDGLRTLGMAILGPHYSLPNVAIEDFKLAREYDLIASMHQGGGEPLVAGGWELVEAAGLLGPKINIVHGNDLTDDRLHRFVDAGVTFSIAPENEMTQGHGFPVTGRIRKLQGRISLGTDLESVVSPDMFAVARMALAIQRGIDNREHRESEGRIPSTSTIPAIEALKWITIEGARMLGMEHRIGSITPGKQADLTMLRASDLNLFPINDPVSTVVMNANSGNVDAVMIAGRFMKRDGRLENYPSDQQRLQLENSAVRILSAFERL